MLKASASERSFSPETCSGTGKRPVVVGGLGRFYIRTCISLYAYTLVPCIHICIYVGNVYVGIYIYVYKRVYIYVYMHIYIYVHLSLSLSLLFLLYTPR